MLRVRGEHVKTDAASQRRACEDGCCESEEGSGELHEQICRFSQSFLKRSEKQIQLPEGNQCSHHIHRPPNEHEQLQRMQ
ncbi:hypothetical protein KUCAC02_035606 [Chaenocephalus aceratus]|nr:hypothetical protein KUCAC02_035606 [Chaenocephalus aceratus]